MLSWIELQFPYMYPSMKLAVCWCERLMLAEAFLQTTHNRWKEATDSIYNQVCCSLFYILAVVCIYPNLAGLYDYIQTLDCCWL